MVKVKLFDEQSYPFRLLFYSSAGNKIGNLIEDEDGQLSFEGNADETAEILFEKIIKLNSKFINNITKKKNYRKVA